MTTEEVAALLMPGEYFGGMTLDAVFSWRDGKFYEAELSICNMDEFSRSSVRVETRTRKHLGLALRRMLVLRRGGLLP